MSGLTSMMSCLHTFSCEHVPRQKPPVATSIPMGLCHDEKKKNKKVDACIMVIV